MKRRLAFSIAFAPLLLMAACGSNSSNPTSPSGPLVVEDLTIGTGATAANGDTLNVNYVGSFTNGSVFEQGPFSFVLGAGQVIAGWDQGLVGMKVGGKRRLTIPPDLAYGPQGKGIIPPNTTLVFVIDLLSIAGK
ncbi:MAG: FKBP-type peptidyl-prolyl cis-trans isomerase [Vicinamibacteria bacterium]